MSGVGVVTDIFVTRHHVEREFGRPTGYLPEPSHNVLPTFRGSFVAAVRDVADDEDEIWRKFAKRPLRKRDKRDGVVKKSVG